MSDFITNLNDPLQTKTKQMELLFEFVLTPTMVYFAKLLFLNKDEDKSNFDYLNNQGIVLKSFAFSDIQTEKLKFSINQDHFDISLCYKLIEIISEY